MATLTIRNLPASVHRALRARAARNGRSTAAEIRHILEQTVLPPNRLKLGTEILRIANEGGPMGNLKFPRHRTSIRPAAL
jgi:plasmid stability protein